MKILVTGASLVLRLLQDEPGVEILGIDSVNDYYDVRFKELLKANSTIDSFLREFLEL